VAGSLDPPCSISGWAGRTTPGSGGMERARQASGRAGAGARAVEARQKLGGELGLGRLVFVVWRWWGGEGFRVPPDPASIEARPARGLDTRALPLANDRMIAQGRASTSVLNHAAGQIPG